MSRIPYETKGGYFSEGETFAQLTEYLRLAAEAAYAIGHNSRANDDSVRADGFLQMGKNLEKMRDIITRFATGRIH